LHELSVVLRVPVDQLVDLDDQSLATYLTILHRPND
jgi:hypothetical protein